MSGFYTWSKTASSNASADTSAPWPEGMAPSQVNDSARGMMASTAKWRDDVSGATITDGTSTDYTVVSNQAFDTLAHLDGQMVAFTVHATNGATVTLNVDGLGGKPLRTAPGVELPAATLIEGAPYVATYYNSAGEFILQGFHKMPEVIPVGGCIPYLGTTVPNNNFAFPYGQTFSRTTYAALFSLVGTTFGPGDGSTTFTGPDIRGRAFFGLDNMGGTAANRITSGGSGITGAANGAVGGAESKTLLTANLPPYTPAGNLTIAASVPISSPQSYNNTFIGGSDPIAKSAGPTSVNFSQASFAGTAQGGTSTAFGIMPPAFVCPVIMRII